MADVTGRRRQRAGSPTGGQFQVESRSEPSVVLATRRWAGAQPMEVDRALDAELTAHANLARHLASRLDRVHLEVGDRRTRAWGAVGAWRMTGAEALAAGDARSTEPRARQALEEYRAQAAAVAEVEARIDEIDAEFEARGGWTRAFLVTGTDGHVHSSRSCSTCNRQGRPTSFALMHEWSGADAERIVADAGWRACTVCYPGAPTGSPRDLPTSMFTAEDLAATAARDARQAAADERAARRLAKAATADGSDLVVAFTAGHKGTEYTEHFATETAARSWYVEHEAMARHERWQSTGPGTLAARQQVLEALAAKHDTTVEHLRAELDKRVTSKIRTL